MYYSSIQVEYSALSRLPVGRWEKGVLLIAMHGHSPPRTNSDAILDHTPCPEQHCRPTGLLACRPGDDR
jgi:hypothetical protein